LVTFDVTESSVYGWQKMCRAGGLAAFSTKIASAARRCGRSRRGLGCRPGCWAWTGHRKSTIRRKLGELAAAGKAADLIVALARRHAGTRPEALGFLYADGHARAPRGLPRRVL